MLLVLELRQADRQSTLRGQAHVAANGLDQCGGCYGKNTLRHVQVEQANDQEWQNYPMQLPKA